MFAMDASIRAEIDLEECLCKLRETAMDEETPMQDRLWAFELLEKYIGTFKRICDSELPTDIIEAIAFGKTLPI